MTPVQIKQKFRREGRTFKEWALEHGFTPNAVYRVLNGCDKANYGNAHRIAVALGMKPPSTDDHQIAA